MPDLPPDPRPNSPVKASWGSGVIATLREQRIIQGPGQLIRRTPTGTRIEGISSPSMRYNHRLRIGFELAIIPGEDPVADAVRVQVGYGAWVRDGEATINIEADDWELPEDPEDVWAEINTEDGTGSIAHGETFPGYTDGGVLVRWLLGRVSPQTDEESLQIEQYWHGAIPGWIGGGGGGGIDMSLWMFGYSISGKTFTVNEGELHWGRRPIIDVAETDIDCASLADGLWFIPVELTFATSDLVIGDPTDTRPQSDNDVLRTWIYKIRVTSGVPSISRIGLANLNLFSTFG